MTGRKPQNKGKRKVAAQQVDQLQQTRQQRHADQQLTTSTSVQSDQSTQSQTTSPVAAPATSDNSVTSSTSSVSPVQRTAKDPVSALTRKIIKAEIDESRTLKHVFKSNPDTQMKDFIKKAVRPNQQMAGKLPKTPADAHPPAVAQELLETDDDVADNLGKLFKASKSYKNL